MLNLFPYTRSGNREEKKKKEKLAGEQNNTTGGNPSFDCTECLYIYYIVVYSRTGCWKGRHSSCLRKMCCLFLSLMEDAMDLNCLERERVCVCVCIRAPPPSFVLLPPSIILYSVQWTAISSTAPDEEEEEEEEEEVGKLCVGRAVGTRTENRICIAVGERCCYFAPLCSPFSCITNGGDGPMTNWSANPSEYTITSSLRSSSLPCLAALLHTLGQCWQKMEVKNKTS